MVLPVTTIYRMGFCEETFFWGLEENYLVRLRQQLMTAEFDVQILCLFLPTHSFFVCIVFTHSFLCIVFTHSFW